MLMSAFCFCRCQYMEQCSRACPQSECHWSCFVMLVEKRFCMHGTSSVSALEGWCCANFSLHYSALRWWICWYVQMSMVMFWRLKTVWCDLWNRHRRKNRWSHQPSTHRYSANSCCVSHVDLTCHRPTSVDITTLLATHTQCPFHSSYRMNMRISQMWRTLVPSVTRAHRWMSPVVTISLLTVVSWLTLVPAVVLRTLFSRLFLNWYQTLGRCRSLHLQPIVLPCLHLCKVSSLFLFFFFDIICGIVVEAISVTVTDHNDCVIA